MRLLIASFIVPLLLGATPSFAQSKSISEMAREERRRCIMQCLGRVRNNDEAASRACFERACGPAPSNASAPKATHDARPNRESVAFVQRRLGELGFDAGPVDGVKGRRTVRAIRAYRRSQGLPLADRIDEELISALRSNASRPTRAARRGTILDVPVIEHGGDGQAANCASSTVAGLNPRGDGFLAVRSGPGTNYRKIDELVNGDVVYTFEKTGDWYGIAYGVARVACSSRVTRPVTIGKQGWVHGNWLLDLAR